MFTTKTLICDLERAAHLRKLSASGEELLIREWGTKVHVLDDWLPLGSDENLGHTFQRGPKAVFVLSDSKEN